MGIFFYFCLTQVPVKPLKANVRGILMRDGTQTSSHLSSVAVATGSDYAFTVHFVRNATPGALERPRPSREFHEHNWC